MPPALIFVLFAVLVIVLAIVGYLQAKKRREALQAFAAEHGLSFDAGRDHGLEQRFPLHGCLREGHDRYGTNVMEGARGERGICAFDYHYETYSTDSKGRRQTHTHWFSAVVVDSRLPLKHLAIRPEGFFDKIAEFVGIDDIDFELGEFSRKFYVKAPDRKWAFDVLHQKTMEFLLLHPKFTVEMAGPWVMVRKTGRFAPAEFSAALGVAEGILDRLPKYLLRELKGEDA
jgi:hypothetical protein